jgi:hypothetical protein
MNLFNTEPMVKHSNQVHTTTDYFLFKPIDGNRNKNLLHLARLKKSMAEHYLFTVIIVNENYEIIDGQHRFECVKELGLPLHYIVCSGYGLNEVHILNQNSKTWNADDYLAGYCNLGNLHYIKYKKFKEKYNFGHNECMAMLSGVKACGGTTFENFKNGNYQVTHYRDAEHKAEKICLFQDIYDGYNRRAFVFAMLYLFDKPQFEFTEFLQKVKNQPTALTHCNDSKQYISLIEEIYNYRRREKVNLRY